MKDLAGMSTRFYKHASPVDSISRMEKCGEEIEREQGCQHRYGRSKGILAEVTALSCWTLYLQLGAVRYWKTIESDPLRTLTSAVES
jgi:hypothetical protein